MKLLGRTKDIWVRQEACFLSEYDGRKTQVVQSVCVGNSTISLESNRPEDINRKKIRIECRLVPSI